MSPIDFIADISARLDRIQKFLLALADAIERDSIEGCPRADFYSDLAMLRPQLANVEASMVLALYRMGFGDERPQER